MTQEQKDAAWRSLPEEVKEEFATDYSTALQAHRFDPNNARIDAHIKFLEKYFGKHNLTASKEEKPKMMSKEKMRQKLELKEYAAKNRKRLKAQKVALGDVVRVLLGQFAGENGIVKGIMVLDNDFNDPYYEVDMECEVSDEYKCRKTLISPNNVIGGLTKSDFEVIGNRMPSEEKPKTISIRTKHGEITIPTKIEYDDSFWLAYRMELAKEVVKAVYNRDDLHEHVIDATMAIVDGIVERLKGGDK